MNPIIQWALIASACVTQAMVIVIMSDVRRIRRVAERRVDPSTTVVNNLNEAGEAAVARAVRDGLAACIAKKL